MYIDSFYAAVNRSNCREKVPFLSLFETHRSADVRSRVCYVPEATIPDTASR